MWHWKVFLGPKYILGFGTPEYLSVKRSDYAKYEFKLKKGCDRYSTLFGEEGIDYGNRGKSPGYRGKEY